MCQVSLCFHHNGKTSITIGSNEAYHNLASPISVKQNLWTFTPSGKSYVFIQSFVFNRWASTSSLGLPEYSGLKWDQFICTGTCWPSCVRVVKWDLVVGLPYEGQGLAVHLLPCCSIYNDFPCTNYTTNLLNLTISWLYSFTTTYVFANKSTASIYLLSKHLYSFNTNSRINSGFLFQEILPSLV